LRLYGRGNIRGGKENFERDLSCLSFWNGKIVLVWGTNGEGEEERNYWDICVAVGGLYEMEALFDLEGNC
jgi:hypothetical protein